MTTMLIIGPPGSGKGTQAERVSKHLGIVAISTGDIFRANVHARTAIGREAEEYLNAGDFVPDRVTNTMVQDRLREPDVKDGFLLDGYPRTMAQVAFLDELLASEGRQLELVLQLTADDEELIARLLGRAKESGRSDDNEVIVRHRLDQYRMETEAVVSEYGRMGILAKVDGIGTMDTVTDRLFHTINARDAIAPRLPAPSYSVAGFAGAFQGM